LSLTNRLSLFFVGALALVLAGFSIALYAIADNYLLGQAKDRLDAAVATLVAAVEFEPGGLEWEPAERRVSLGKDNDPEAIRWIIRDTEGSLVDASLNQDPSSWSVPLSPRDSSDRTWEGSWDGQTWHVRQIDLQGLPGVPSPDRADAKIYPGLELTAAISLTPVQALMNKLGIILTTLSAVILFGAALLGRRLCRRALIPLGQMSAAARSMGEADWGTRLPCPNTKDELADLGASFNNLLDRLQDAYERQRRFTSEASHQLRTPLTAMLGQVEIGLRRPRSADDYRRILVQVEGQAQQLRQIIEMLLFLARADADAALPDLEPVHFQTWLTNYLPSWEGHPRFKDLCLELETAECCFLQAHPALLGQLVGNLIDNACKYSAPGTPITIRLEHGPGSCSCAIEDQGDGIDSIDLPHVFEPFYRSARSRQSGIPGMGLGLAVARRIAMALGGEIVPTSTLGQGSCFTLRLPVIDAPKALVAEDWVSYEESSEIMPQSAPLSISTDPREVT
jgi:two-component system OmpR family sensor kinase